MSQNLSEDKRVRVGITLGDMNGVGPETIIKTFSDNRMLHICSPVIYGSGKVLSFYRKQLDLAEFNYNTIRSNEELKSRKLNLINCWDEEVKVEPGIPSPNAGKYAFTALQKACEDLSAGKLDVLVTAPIDKKTMQQEGFRFPGHTEYLTQQFGGKESLMMLVGDSLRVATMTGHMPLSEVPAALNPELIHSKIRIMHESLIRDFGVRKPKIAILGLNPHSGDDGLIGSEEKEILIPIIEDLKQKGLLIFGPYSADGFFGSSLYKQFDGVMATYHDQGLIPFKSIAFDTGVNFTAGLPIVRTSPDHGTAYDIAGKGVASEQSIRSAVYLACDIYRKRAEFEALSRDPLKLRKGGKDN
jgi:4-hydroxythreonine-4-phosphate dehydrogenase